MEYANGILSISEGSFPTIGRKSKAVREYEGWNMGGSWQKVTRNDTVVPVIIDVLKNLKRKEKIAYNEGIAKLCEKPSASNKVFLMKRLFTMNMSEGGFVVNQLNEFNMVTNKLSFVGENFNTYCIYLEFNTYYLYLEFMS